MLFKIFLHTAIFALRYFILLHLAYNLYEYNLDTINGAYVILYADDILLMSHSISMLQTLLTTCENELDTIGMAINTRKSCCIRVGPRHNIPCVAINTNDGSKLLWSEELRYLGVFIVQCVSFRCSIDYAKRSFYRAANGIFAKLGRLASEEVILELIMKKMYPSSALWSRGL